MFTLFGFHDQRIMEWLERISGGHLLQAVLQQGHPDRVPRAMSGCFGKLHGGDSTAYLGSPCQCCHCWFMFNLVSRTSRFFSAELLSSWMIPSIYWCQGFSLPTCTTAHLVELNETLSSPPLQPADSMAHFSTTLLCFLSSANLLRVHYSTSSRSLTKMLNRIGTSTNPWGTVSYPQQPPTTFCAGNFSDLQHSVSFQSSSLQSKQQLTICSDLLEDSQRPYWSPGRHLHCSPSFIKLFISLQKLGSRRWDKHSLSLLNSGWWLLVIFLSFICLEMPSRITAPSPSQGSRWGWLPACSSLDLPS